ncbi:hypothetical protein Tco_0117370 [Tanacetum coccineum]
MKKINDGPDNVDAIQESFKEAHPTKECPLKRRTRQLSKASIWDPWRKPSSNFAKTQLKNRSQIMNGLGSRPFRARETICMIENPGEIHKTKAQEDEGDMDVGWDITIKDVKRLRQFLTPTIHTLPNSEPIVQLYMLLGPVHDKIVREEEQDYDIPLHDVVMQPLTPQTIHIIPPDDDYVAPATNPILDTN